MNTVQPNNSEKFVTLQQAAEKLGVSIATLLSWNENNILKPTITQNGEVVYVKEQIDQFMIIRQLTGATVTGIEKIVPQHHQAQQYVAPVPFSQPVVPMQSVAPETYAHTRTHRKHTPRLFITSFAALALLIAIGVFVPQGGLAQLLGKQVETGEKVLGIQTSKLQLPGQIIAALPIELNKETKKNIQNEGEGVSKEQISAPALYKAKTIAMNTKETQVKIATATPSKTLRKPDTLAMTDTASSATYTSTSYFQDECASCVADKDSAIDERGNIKGDAKTTTIASILGGFDGIVGGDALKPTNTDATNQLLFFLIGALAVMYLTQQQFAYSRAKSQSNPQDEYKHRQTLALQKILEVNQKTDGTVFLAFQGKEFKISKPELDSESDRFIEGLMELMQPHMKEIEYDMDNNKFITPLSRLVTRLGFVGMKRDLFFPSYFQEPRALPKISDDARSAGYESDD